MKKFVACVAAVLLCGSAVIAAELKSGLEVGDSVNPFYVQDVTGPSAGKDPLCYRCQYGARPVVAVFTRKVDDKVAALVKEVDSKVLERGQLRIDLERHTCTWKNQPVTLTVTEFLILQALASRPGVVKSRNALMDAAYDDQVYVDDRTIDSHIKRLRIKFRASDLEFDMIETLYGVGYRFKEL